MKKVVRIFGILFLALLAVLLVGPFLVPAPPLEGTRPVRELAGPDGKFIEINGVDVHYLERGQPDSPVNLLLLHGFAASTFSWREVLGPLAQAAPRYVVAFDRPAFGLTERPLEWQGDNPYTLDSQARLTVDLMDALGMQRAVLVGNSAGGTLAVYTALTYPERVEALVLVDPAIYAGGGPSAWVRPLLRTPQARRLGPLFVRNIRNWGQDFARSAWHDPTRITDEIWQGYNLPLQAENWDRGLWELVAASGDSNLAARLGELQVPVLVITGDDDRIVPTADSIRLASEIPGAELVVIPQCGHIPQEECPEAFLEAVEGWIE